MKGKSILLATITAILLAVPAGAETQPVLETPVFKVWHGKTTVLFDSSHPWGGFSWRTKPDNAKNWDTIMSGDARTRRWGFCDLNRCQNGWDVYFAGKVIVNGKNLGADYVFEPDYELESIEEHAEFMWKNKHLAALPSAASIEENGLDVTAIQRSVIEELEKAHIYIEQLHDRLAALEGKLSQPE